jgi:hypothetical protein
MIRVYQHEKFWILIKNFHLAESSGGRAGSFRGKPTFDSWAGDAWANEPAMAKRFKTREEAQQYLDDNRSRMEA